MDLLHSTQSSCAAKSLALQWRWPATAAAACCRSASATLPSRCSSTTRGSSHLIDGLMLDPEHPRKDTNEGIKTAVQRDFAECVQQIALFPAGCDALKANEGIMHALSTLKDKAWSEEAKVCAEGALMALIPPEHHEVDPDALHIMLSCECTPVFSRAHLRCGAIDRSVMYILDQWDVQEVIKQIVAELQRRKFLVWFDRKCRTHTHTCHRPSL